VINGNAHDRFSRKRSADALSVACAWEEPGARPQARVLRFDFNTPFGTDFHMSKVKKNDSDQAKTFVKYL
jgi:hypothetical protein